MKITLDTEKEIVIVKEVKTKLKEINVREVVDNPEQKYVQAFTLELGAVILWKDAEYDAIGQWTDTDVINKLKSL
jgi:hypothetical protein